MTIVGDVKASYMLRDYFGLNVNALQELQYLTGKTGLKPQILFAYEQMVRNGYVIYGGYSLDLPEDWMEKALQLNLVYSNRDAFTLADGILIFNSLGKRA